MIIFIIAMLKCKLHSHGISTGTKKCILSVDCRVTICVLYICTDCIYRYRIQSAYIRRGEKLSTATIVFH